MPGRWHIGTSGWSYANWKPAFYPKGVAPRDWLAYYARHLKSVELNASFYRLPRASVVEGWRDRTPENFVFAVKAWRAITHYRRLADCEDLVGRLFDRVAPLGRKTGPVLFQLPPHFEVNTARLENFLTILPHGRRYAFEFRDPGWHCDEVYALLERHKVAFCPFELGQARAPRIVTADFIYVRLHGRKAAYEGAYSVQALTAWCNWLEERLREKRDVYVYFDNTDVADHAVRNAIKLDELLSRRMGSQECSNGGGHKKKQKNR